MLTTGCKKDDETPSGTVKDRDGNVYHTVTIGTQVWMVENLKTTKYNDGTSIPLVTEGSSWEALSTPGYTWYKKDSATYKTTYGALYNGYAVKTGKLCPKGWHVPTDAEWTVLTDYLGGWTVAGGKLKEVGFTHWNSPNGGATNETGFSSLPGGYRHWSGDFDLLGIYGYWWSSTGNNSNQAYYRHMDCQYADLYRESFDLLYGLSVRCLKD